MSNTPNPETLLIRRQEADAARKRRPPPQYWPSSPRATAATSVRARPPLLSLNREKSPPLPLPGTLTASRLKITVMLNAAELAAVTAPPTNGADKQRVTLRIRLPDRTISAEVAAKSLRKSQNAIREVAADAIVVMLQGHLVAGDRVAEAGLSAQVKAPKPAPRPDASERREP
jgi:hypothetical protein